MRIPKEYCCKNFISSLNIFIHQNLNGDIYKIKSINGDAEIKINKCPFCGEKL